jgi:hypothetical protein
MGVHGWARQDTEDRPRRKIAEQLGARMGGSTATAMQAMLSFKLCGHCAGRAFARESPQRTSVRRQAADASAAAGATTPGPRPLGFPSAWPAFNLESCGREGGQWVHGSPSVSQESGRHWWLAIVPCCCNLATHSQPQSSPSL